MCDASNYNVHSLQTYVLPHPPYPPAPSRSLCVGEGGRWEDTAIAIPRIAFTGGGSRYFSLSRNLVSPKKEYKQKITILLWLMTEKRHQNSKCPNQVFHNEWTIVIGRNEVFELVNFKINWRRKSRVFDSRRTIVWENVGERRLISHVSCDDEASYNI